MRTTDHRGLVRPVPRDLRGLEGPTPEQTRGSAWRRTSRGLYVPAAVDGSVPEQRVVEAAPLVPRGGGVTGWAAVRWWTGSPWFDGTTAAGGVRPVAVVTPEARVRPRTGVVVSEERVVPGDVVEVDGVAVTRPACAVSFEVRRRTTGVAEAVVCLDMACGTDAVSLAELREVAASQAGWTGVGLLRLALDLAEENSWSPQESRARMAWVQAGLPRPRCNAPLFDLDGRHLGTPDLLDPVTGVVAEYDGRVHLGRRLQDVRREEVFRDHGLEYVTTLAGDRGPLGFVARLRRAYDRATAARDRGEVRGWCADPPAWWVGTGTVAQRRALGPAQRARLLRYRR
ncbi:hypothetical protein [Nocardioides sp. AX2bis]|uniref:hypothetical protein n=1 Tax=Nocardioides sp. AX2bis TaxID=2653157 RepID=UPI0012F01D0D|nr:hypothetical protein [Nocardioides sp. AX2bis]VXC45934.1 conserved hypothetical protein [Nocardioides sp. AX2bis]